MGKEHIRFSASILRRLGEELNLGFDQGILELVKNAYDADATQCIVELIDIDLAGGTVRVTDTGVGMTDTQIINGWLVLGESQKKSAERTPIFKRFPAGNKGLGRLAALRMGTVADLQTHPKIDSKSEYLISIDWDKFDNVRSVDEVALEVVKIDLDREVEHGTVITISNLRDRLTRMDIKRLARGMLLLADPFGSDTVGFQPILKTQDFQDLEKLVERRYFNDSEFHLYAEITANGQARGVVKDYNGNILYEANHDAIRLQKNAPPYLLPPITFDLWVFIFDSRVFATRSISKGEVRDWLNEFGGVHLYINGIRVTPYGNPGDDWLGLNLARVQNPEFRPGTNTSIGRVSIQEPGNRFAQKTDRTGLIEDEDFIALKAFTKDALDWMARERLREAEYRRVNNRITATEDVMREKYIVEKVFNSLPAIQKLEAEKSFRLYDQAREREAAALRKDVLLYRTLSTVGIVAAVFAHETTRPADLIARNAKRIEKKAKSLLANEYNSNLKKPIELILAQTALMEGFQSLTLGFLEKDKRRNQRVEIHAVINSALRNFQLILKERHVTVSTDLMVGTPYVRGSAAALEAVIANFIVNSIRAFDERQVGNRQILIRTYPSQGWLILRFIDNGPGIETIDLKDIWSPGESGYERGTGLGLTIVRDTIRDIGGTVDVEAHGEMNGAEFIISIPVIGF
jgi:signal transduction histidine kinase